MNNKFNQAQFNYNISIDSNAQNYNMQSPAFGTHTKNPRSSNEPPSQILINNNFINIQQTIADPNSLLHQATTKPDAPQHNPQGHEITSRRNFYFKKGYQQGMQAPQPKKSSQTTSTEDMTKLKLNMLKSQGSSDRVGNVSYQGKRGLML